MSEPCGLWVVETEGEPWPAAVCEVGYGIWVRESQGIADDIPDADECRDNAHLMAAAPELLDVAKMALGFVAAFSGYYQVAYETGAQIHPRHQEALDQISAAISKAEGRTADKGPK